MSRYEAGGREGLVDRSHRPASCPHQITADVKVVAYLGRVLDMLALSDLVTRPVGHPIAEQATQQIRRLVACPGAA
jgi:hypothetical protein